MKKNQQLNIWLWKWHFIAGIIALPFIILLSITGGVYLFKDRYEKPLYQHIKEVKAIGTPISFQEQWAIANANAVKKPNSMLVPTSKTEATEFISGRFSHKTSIYINPYTAAVSGEILPKDSLMFNVRKLHGELLLGKYGTKIVELIACWMLVLIITGLYVWWPFKKWRVKGVFTPRTKQGKRTLYRDFHAVFSFWISVLLLLTLAGGLPWTDVFGDYFKWMQKVTNTGYPTTWAGFTMKSEAINQPLTLDQMVAIAKQQNLEGDLFVHFPKGKEGVYSVSNTNYTDLGTQKMIHFDQYSGKQIFKNNWKDVGVLMRARMWLMAFHQGQFGLWNRVLMLFIAIALLFVSISALASYWLRKPKGDWGVPSVPESFKVGYGVIGIIMVLALMFPLFALSLIFILLIEFLRKKVFKTT